MSTSRPARGRFVHVGVRRVELERRMVLILVCVAFALFVGFYVLGRLSSHVVSPGPIPVAGGAGSADAGVPAGLGSVPAIEPGAAPKRAVNTAARAAQASPAAVRQSSATVTPASTATGAPTQTIVSKAPVIKTAPISAPVAEPKSPAASAPPASHNGGSGQGKSQSSTGTSFDSSG